MTVSVAMLAELGNNVTFLAEAWKMVSRDGSVAAYIAHTRNLTFNSVAYSAAPIEPSQTAEKIGLDPNSAELTGVFDSIVTEADIDSGKWKRARITKEVINYLDTSTGSVNKHVGFAGKFSKSGDRFTVEFQSLSSLLSQLIGALTSPTDRRARLDELGIDLTPFTHLRTVLACPDRRNVSVNGAPQIDGYFKNGLAHFTTGANAGLEMEIKTNVGNSIELQLPMRGVVANSDSVTLYRGYNGTRDDAKALGAILSMEAEPDVPGLTQLITYPG